MRILVTRCSIRYEGRLVTTLEIGDRVVLFKDDGSVVVHAVQGAKPINYMPGPTVVQRGRTHASRSRDPRRGERLVIDVEDVHADTALRAGGHRQARARGPREGHPGDDLRDARRRSRRHGRPPARAVHRGRPGRPVLPRRRRAARASSRSSACARSPRRSSSSPATSSRSDRNPAHAPARGILVAPELAPQARVLLDKRGYDFVALDEVLARCDGGEALMRLF